MDFKNRGEAEVFKHEDPRAWSLTYLENWGVFILKRSEGRLGSCGFYYVIRNDDVNEIYLTKVMNSSYIRIKCFHVK